MESRIVVTREWRKEKMVVVVNTYRVSVLSDERFLELCFTIM